MRIVLLTILAALSACGVVSSAPSAVSVSQHAQGQFWQAANRVKPVAEDLCRAGATDRRCDFQIIVDDRPNLAPDARQALAPDGRPVLTVTSSMIARAEHPDELAFILAHEAAHHIQDHLPRLRQIAERESAGGTFAMTDAGAIPTDRGLARARASLKGFELEADALGAQIAAAAGFDPLNGAGILKRLAGPQRNASVSHPAVADRLQIVREEVAGSSRMD